MYGKILFVTDGSQFSMEALRDAVQLAKLSEGKLRVLSVVESPAFHGTPEAMALYQTEMYKSLQAELEKVARGAVERASAFAVDSNVSVTTCVRDGLPADEIVREAKDWEADCIVMATHGRSGFGRLLLGSVASKIVQHAPCPVLLHRATEKGTS